MAGQSTTLGSAPTGALPVHAAPAAPVWVLVGCSKSKLAHPAKACELYTGQLFRLARRYASARAKGVHDQWFVLSALHGLAHPNYAVKPYDVSLAGMDAAGRWKWALVTAAAVREWASAQAYQQQKPVLVFLAGRLYTEHLAELLGDFEQEHPLRGLGIGQQMAWLLRATAGLLSEAGRAA